MNAMPFIWASPACGATPVRLSKQTHERIAAGVKLFANPHIEIHADQRWIKTRTKVFQYPSQGAAEQALPRIRRADNTARILTPEEATPVLAKTPAIAVVYYAPRK